MAPSKDIILKVYDKHSYQGDIPMSKAEYDWLMTHLMNRRRLEFGVQ